MEPVSFIVLIGFVAGGLASYLEAVASMREGTKRAKHRSAMIQHILGLRLMIARQELYKAERAACTARGRLEVKIEVTQDEGASQGEE